jgi:hypothetical protein
MRTQPELDGPEVGAGIDIAVFLQIIELDDEGTHEYSKHMVLTYFSQVTKTFEGMDIALYVPLFPSVQVP